MMNATHLQKFLQKLSVSEVCESNADLEELVGIMSRDGQTPKKITASDVLIDGTIQHCPSTAVSSFLHQTGGHDQAGATV